MFETGLIILMFVALGFVGWSLSQKPKPKMNPHEQFIYEEELTRLKARRDFNKDYHEQKNNH